MQLHVRAAAPDRGTQEKGHQNDDKKTNSDRPQRRKGTTISLAQGTMQKLYVDPPKRIYAYA